jgi:urease accessory protein
MSSTNISAFETVRPAAAAATAPSTAPGYGSLRIAARGPRSVVERAYATSPLRILTPANHGHAAWVYLSSFGGGLVDGDRQLLDVDVCRGAAAFVSTQASTKVYRSPNGTAARVAARVADDGLLILAPDPVVCFAESRFDQHQEFEVAGDGALVVVDWVSSGRRESGERWAFARYTSRLVARLDGALLVHDSVALRRDEGPLAARLGRFDVLATVLIVGRKFAVQATALAGEIATLPVKTGAQQLAAATVLDRPHTGIAGCLLRVAGRSVEDVGGTVRRWLQFVPPLLRDDPWARKW